MNEEDHWRHYGVILLTFTPCSSVSNVNFEHLIFG